MPNLSLIPPREMRVKTWAGLRPIAEFDEVEVHEMCEGEDGELWQAADCHPGQPVEGYTVFLHCASGGVECVQDFRFAPDMTASAAAAAAKHEAENLATQLGDMLRASGMLRSIRAGLPAKEFGA